MSSNVQFKWYCGTAIIAPQPILKMVEIPARRQGKTQALAMKLSEMMKRGIVKSAWGDNDTPDDVGLSQRDGTVAERQEAERKAAIERADRRKNEEFQRLRIAEEKAREEERQRTEAAIEQMEAMDGFGSF